MTGRHRQWLERPNAGEDLADRAMRAGGWASAAQVLRSVVELAATLILARLLVPEQFGVVGMVLAVTGFLVLFKDLGLSTATIQRPTISQGEVSALLLINIGAGAMLTLLCALGAPVLAFFYEEPRLVDITLVLSTTFLLGSLGVQHHALLRRNLAFGRIAAVEVAAGLAGVIAALVAAYAGWGYWALVVRAIASEVVAGVAPWILCSWRPTRPTFDANVKELASFGGNITGFGVVNYFARNLDDILIGRMFGAAALGHYQKAYELLMLPLRQINKPIGDVALPALSELDPSSERYANAYIRIVEKLLLITTLLGIVLCACADWIVLIVLGDQWTVAAPIFAWLGLLVFTQPLANTSGWLFITQDRTDDMLRWGVVGSALAVASFVVGLPWGALGVAASYSVSGVLVRTPLLMWFVTRKGPLTMLDLGKVMLPYLGVAVTVIAACIGIRMTVDFESKFTGFGTITVVAIVLYLAAVVALPQCRAALVDAVKLGMRLVRARAEGGK